MIRFSKNIIDMKKKFNKLLLLLLHFSVFHIFERLLYVKVKVILWEAKV
jgi:hypothetical protein